MKHLLLILTFLSLTVVIYAQNKPIEKVFLSLPDKLFDDLTPEEKLSLLKNKKFYPKYNSSESKVVYKLRDNEKYNDRISIGMYFETGQSAYYNTEIRIFLKTDGDTIVIFSKYGGTSGLAEQIELYCFSLKNKIPILQYNLLPDNIPISEFFKPNTPDSIYDKYGGNNYYFDLIDSEENTVKYLIDFRWNNYKDSCLLGYEYIFSWTNDMFEGKLKLEDE